jgi:hypothetical protein
LLITVSIIVVVPPTFKLPLIFTVFKLDVPDTFNDDNNVDALERTKIEILVLSCNDVYVVFKLFIDDINNVDVLFKLFIDFNVDVEKL